MRYFVLASIFASSLGLADCKLNHPIHLGSFNFMKTPLILYRAVVNETPRFFRPGNYNPATDSLEVRLFNIEWNQRPTGFAGARVAVFNKVESVGFSFGYIGNFNFLGSTETVQGMTTYHTNFTYRPQGAQHAPGDAVTDVSIKVEKEDIVAVELKQPVFKVWKSTPSVDILAFTGDHQTLCVLDADLKP